MVAKRLFWVLGLLVITVPLLAAANGELVGNLEAFRVVVTNDGEEKFLSANEAGPSDVIEYRLTYKNDGATSVQNIFIMDPIPAGMNYVGLSATEPDIGRVEFSIDHGQTYHSWPVKITRELKNGKTEVVEATPDMVSNIRWVITDEFKPKNTITVSYRTEIE